MWPRAQGKPQEVEVQVITLGDELAWVSFARRNICRAGIGD
jgi:hypothetical protein